ncbi:unnamed protein product [Choristocarpus tenellus]
MSSRGEVEGEDGWMPRTAAHPGWKKPGGSRVQRYENSRKPLRRDEETKKGQSNSTVSDSCKERILRCMYTKQKTKKRKSWSDGAAHCCPKRLRVHLYRWSEVLGSTGALLGEVYLSAPEYQAFVGKAEPELEMEQFIVSLDGVIEDSPSPAMRDASAPSNPNCGSTIIGGMYKRKTVLRPFKPPARRAPPVPTSLSGLPNARGEAPRGGYGRGEHTGFAPYKAPCVINNGFGEVEPLWDDDNDGNIVTPKTLYSSQGGVVEKGMWGTEEELGQGPREGKFCSGRGSIIVRGEGSGYEGVDELARGASPGDRGTVVSDAGTGMLTGMMGMLDGRQRALPVQAKPSENQACPEDCFAGEPYSRTTLENRGQGACADSNLGFELDFGSKSMTGQDFAHVEGDPVGVVTRQRFGSGLGLDQNQEQVVGVQLESRGDLANYEGERGGGEEAGLGSVVEEGGGTRGVRSTADILSLFDGVADTATSSANGLPPLSPSDVNDGTLVRPFVGGVQRGRHHCSTAPSQGQSRWTGLDEEGEEQVLTLSLQVQDGKAQGLETQLGLELQGQQQGVLRDKFSDEIDVGILGPETRRGMSPSSLKGARPISSEGKAYFACAAGESEGHGKGDDTPVPGQTEQAAVMRSVECSGMKAIERGEDTTSRSGTELAKKDVMQSGVGTGADTRLLCAVCGVQYPSSISVCRICGAQLPDIPTTGSRYLLPELAHSGVVRNGQHVGQSSDRDLVRCGRGSSVGCEGGKGGGSEGTNGSDGIVKQHNIASQESFLQSTLAPARNANTVRLAEGNVQRISSGSIAREGGTEVEEAPDSARRPEASTSTMSESITAIGQQAQPQSHALHPRTLTPSDTSGAAGDVEGTLTKISAPVITSAIATPGNATACQTQIQTTRRPFSSMVMDIGSSSSSDSEG